MVQPQGVRTKIDELFGIDLRALAVFRIGLALIILVDLADRAPDIAVFYTDAGVLPRAVVIDLLNFTPLSAYLISGEASVQTFLFLFQGLCAVGLLLGWRTRLMTVLSWFLMSSLYYRNLMVLFGADFYVRMMLFWSLFLPLGARFSLDRARNASDQPLPLRLVTCGTAAILFQNAIVYLVTGFIKWGHATWHKGTALFYSMSVDVAAKEFADALLQFPSLLQFGTHVTLYLELIGPFLLFCPVWTSQVRLVVVFLIVLMNLGIHLTLKLWIFPWINIVALFVFLPSGFWDRIPGCDRTPAPKHRVSTAEPGWVSACVLVAFCAIVYWNLTVVAPSAFPMTKAFSMPYRTLHINQDWKMFADPQKFGSGWAVVTGKLSDGSRINLLDDGSPFTDAKPVHAKNFTSSRWRRYITFLNSRADDRARKPFMQYMCRSWNDAHEGAEKIVAIEVINFGRNVDPERRDQGTYKKVGRFREECG